MLADQRDPKTIAEALGIPQVLLPYADYQWYAYNGARCLCERKTISDALNSLKEHRLQEQLRNMLALPNTISILLIEGYWTCTKDFFIKWGKHTSGWKLSSFVNHLLTFQHEGVKLVFSPSLNATIYLLEALYYYYQKAEHKALDARPKPLWASSNTRGKQIYLLSALPGIGPELAGRILEKHSPMDVLYNPHLLEEIEGIAGGKISEIEKVLGLIE